MNTTFTAPNPLKEPYPKMRRFPGFGYAAFCRSASDLGGGDLCDVVPLSDHSLLLVMADVMGKGAPAALFAASLRTLVRAVAHPGVDPAQCLAEVNDLMFEQLSSEDTFITAQIVVADLACQQLLIGNAGHCPLLLSDGFNSIEAIAPQGMPLGIQRDTCFESECVLMEPFSSVLLYTDGMTEARNPAGKLYGQERLQSWFCRSAANNHTAASLKQSLLREISDFQHGHDPTDDQSFLILADETPRPTAMFAGDSLRWFIPWRQSQRSAALTAG